jgi:predicted permease
MALHDVVIASRVLRKNPGFTLTAVLTIALGVGASTAIFSVANAVLLRPLPYKDPDRLVIASMDLRQRNVRDLPFSNADFIDLRDGTKDFFEDFAGLFTGLAIVPQDNGTTEQIRWAVVTTNFFHVTGTGLVLGRDFTGEDGTPQAPAPPASVQAPAAAPVPASAILSYEFFQRRYGGNASVLGQTMRATGGQNFVIVGVLAPRFHLYFPPAANVEAAPDVWIANRLAYDPANRNNFSIRPVGRLKQGASLDRAQTAAEQVATETREKYSLWQTAGYHIQLESMQQHLVAGVRPAILALMGSVIFLLLIACANVANLLLVRASLLERELALRAAIGASGWQLIRPILAEAFLLGAMGTLLGCGLAWAGIHELRVLAPANLPRLETIRIDRFVLGFGAFAGFAAAIIFGMAPAWPCFAAGSSKRASRRHPNVRLGEWRFATQPGCDR